MLCVLWHNLYRGDPEWLEGHMTSLHIQVMVVAIVVIVASIAPLIMVIAFFGAPQQLLVREYRWAPVLFVVLAGMFTVTSCVLVAVLQHPMPWLYAVNSAIFVLGVAACGQRILIWLIGCRVQWSVSALEKVLKLFTNKTQCSWSLFAHNATVLSFTVLPQPSVIRMVTVRFRHELTGMNTYRLLIEMANELSHRPDCVVHWPDQCTAPQMLTVSHSQDSPGRLEVNVS